MERVGAGGVTPDGPPKGEPPLVTQGAGALGQADGRMDPVECRTGGCEVEFALGEGRVLEGHAHDLDVEASGALPKPTSHSFADLDCNDPSATLEHGDRRLPDPGPDLEHSGAR